LVWIPGWLPAAGALLLLVAANGLLEAREPAERWLLAAWFSVMVLAAASGLARPQTAAVLAAVPAYLLFAVAVRRLPVRVARSAAAVVLAALLVGGFLTAAGAVLPREEWREAARLINQETGRNEALVLVAPAPERAALALGYYLERPRPIVPIRAARLDAVEWQARRAQLESFERISVVVDAAQPGGSTDSRPDPTLAAVAGLELIEAERYRGAVVARYRVQRMPVTEGGEIPAHGAEQTH
jgi:hypothetical protein